MANRIYIVFLAVLMAVTIFGCGGGSGGGGATPLSPAATADKDAASSYIHQNQVTTIMLGSSGGNGEARRASTLALALRRPQGTQGYVYIGYGYYAEVAQTSSSTAIAYLSTNGTTNNAGAMQFSGIGSSTVPIDWNITAGVLISTGTMTFSNFVVNPLSGDFSMDMHYQGETIDASGSFDGEAVSIASIAVTGGPAQFGTFSATSNGQTAPFTVGSISGTITTNSDGSGSAYSKDSTGTWTLSWDTSYNGTLTGPKGQKENLGTL